jgi:hypothetical protein
MNCTGCNQPISRTNAYGEDTYSSCEVCEWHSEGEGSSTIKQGLTLEELVAHKKKLNKLYDRLHKYAFTTVWVRDRREPEEMMLELRNIMNELIDEEE